MSLGDATGEKAALANVIVEMFQTAISGERKRSGKKRGERGEDGGKRGEAET